MRIYTEKELAALGYVETSPGIFERTKPIADPTEKKKKLPEHLAHIKQETCIIGGKKCKFRSGWEKIYATYLELLKTNGSIKDWEYEPHRFEFPIKRGCNSYLPDFKVIENDDSHWWAEIKGYLDKKGATRLKRMAKYFPQEVVKLIRREEINDIKKSGLVKI